MADQPETLEVDGWVVRVRRPPGEGMHPVILLNHGWTGDENSMWVFASRLPKDAILVAPRAPFRSALGGYSWAESRGSAWSRLEDFRPAVESYLRLLENLPEHLDADFSKVSLVGFSQGGAFSYSFALLHPGRVTRLAGLASFMPQEAEETIAQHPLKGLPIFVGHGQRDELVPVEMARQAVRKLEAAGAQVNYCETDVGHKLGADCFRAFKDFFAFQL